MLTTLNTNLRQDRRLVVATAVFAVITAILLAATFSASAEAAKKKSAKKKAPSLTLSTIAVGDRTITLSGKAKLPGATKKQLKKTRVQFQLDSDVGIPDFFSVAVKDGKFSITEEIGVWGLIKIRAKLKIGEKSVGKAVTRKTIVPTPPPFVPTPTPPTVLNGNFKITAGAQPDTAVTGSYFRIVGTDGTTYVENADSTATTKTYTLLTPGTELGLKTSGLQAPPDPAFDTGNALAAKIIQPVAFNGKNLGLATVTTKPALSATAAGVLSGQVTGLKAYHNDVTFSQGSTTAKGTYTAATKAYKLDWKAPIVGGDYDGQTGVWHLEGTFATP